VNVKKKLIFLAVFLFFSIYTISVKADTIILNDTNGGNVGDSTISSSDIFGNYGSNDNILVQGNDLNDNWRVYILWNLSGIPAGVTITNANMSTYSSGFDNGGNYSVSNTTNNWEENTLTWDNQPSANIFQYNQTLLTYPSWIYANVTNATISSFSQANKNMSIVIIDLGENIANPYKTRYIASKEDATASLRPQLIITYVLSQCDYYIDNTTIPYTITQNNTRYCLNQSIGKNIVSGINFAAGVQNTSLDCQGYTIGGNDTTNSNGIYLVDNTTSNVTVKNCIIKDYSNGIYLDYNVVGPKNCSFINNTVTSSGYGFRVRYITNISVINGSYHGNTVDYGLRSADNQITFTSTNFTGLRTVYFYDNTNWFNYRNTTNSIWFNMTASSVQTVNLTITNMSQTNMSWNTNARDSAVTTTYNLSGLKTNTNYDMFNFSQYVNTVVTDSNGILSFSVPLNTTERELKVEETVYNLSSCDNLYSNGTYYLLNNVSSSGVCFNITGNNVTLNCQNKFISSIGDTAIDLKANYTTIKNCNFNGGSTYNIYTIASIPTTYGNITNNTFRDSYFGIYLEGTLNFSVVSNNITQNGVILLYSNNTFIYNNTMNTGGWGIFLQTNSNNNNITFNSITEYTTAGISIDTTSNNLIFNNKLKNKNNIILTTGNNNFNITKQTGTRIYSIGPNIGGNYYTNSTNNGYSDKCLDEDQNGFCDYPLNISNMILCLEGVNCSINNTDYFPLSPNYAMKVNTNERLSFYKYSDYNFFDGFETDTITSNWTVYGTNQNRTQVTNLNGPQTGTYHLTMDDNSGDATYSLNELITAYNFTGASKEKNISVTFGVKSFSDDSPDCPSTWENHYNCAGLSYTCNSTTWYNVMNLTGLDLTYATRNVNFTPICTEINSSFAVKFSQYSNYPIATVGLAFDNINITYQKATNIDSSGIGKDVKRGTAETTLFTGISSRFLNTFKTLFNSIGINDAETNSGIDTVYFAEKVIMSSISSLVYNFIRPSSDRILFFDSAANSFNILRRQIDITSIIDFQTTAENYYRNSANNALISGVSSMFPTRFGYVSSIISFSDITNNRYDIIRKIQENAKIFGVLDSVKRGDYYKYFTEASNLLDANGRIASLSNKFSDSFSMANVVSKFMSRSYYLSDTIQPSHITADNSLFSRLSSDYILLTDNTAKSLGIIRLSIDKIILIDYNNINSGKLFLFAENMILKPADARLYTFLKMNIDIINFSDTSSNALIRIRSFTNIMTITDASSRMQSKYYTMYNSMLISDVSTRMFNEFTQVADKIILSDIFTYRKSGEYILNFLDKITIQDTQGRIIQASRNLQDILTFDASNSFIRTVNLQFSNGMNMVDSTYKYSIYEFRRIEKAVFISTIFRIGPTPVNVNMSVSNFVLNYTNTNISVYATTLVNISGYMDDKMGNISLFIDDVAVANPYGNTFGAGEHMIKINTTGNDIYMSNYTGVTYYIISSIPSSGAGSGGGGEEPILNITNITTYCGDGLCDSTNGETIGTCPLDCKPQSFGTVATIELGIIILAGAYVFLTEYRAPKSKRRAHDV
jgi:parallel beta-helix repeat protein